MSGIPILQDLVITLAMATLIILISHRLRVPPLIGLLLTGVVIGPSGLALVDDSREVQVLAEIGVVALLFSIGLEFSLARLRQIQRAFFVGGGLQSGITIALAGGSAWLALGFGLRQSIFVSFLVALSSTAIVMKLLSDRKEIESPHGRLAIGILLFQDFMIVPMIAVTPLLGGAGEVSGGALMTRFALGVLAMVAIFVTARYLMPLLLRLVVRTGIRELFVLGSVLACLGMALLTESLHFSLALGAFVAGLIISESEYSHQVVADILPFRDVFNSIFFVSIGMLLSLGFLRANLFAILVGAAILLFGKGIVIVLIVRAMKYPLRTALIVGASLAQIGEFSFVVANLGRSYGLLEAFQYQWFIAAAVLTMMITPVLIGAAQWFSSRGEPARDTREESPDTLERHVVIVGFGVNGRNLAKVLGKLGISYTAIDLDGTVVDRARQDGEPILYGDATRIEILEHCGLRRANVIVFGISDPAAVRRAVSIVKQINPSVYVVVRTRQVSEIDELYRLGADHVMAEEFETSIEILTRVLQRYHVPTNVIQAQRRALRGDKYQLLRKDADAPVSEAVLEILAEGATEVFRVDESCHAVDRTIAELDLRERSGASIIAIVRDGIAVTNPQPEFTIEANDFIVLIGGHFEIDTAFELLTSGPGS